MPKPLTDEEVEAEIARLSQTEQVSLARKEERLKHRNRRRNQLYQLRQLEKRGQALMDAGITRQTLDAMYE